MIVLQTTGSTPPDNLSPCFLFTRRAGSATVQLRAQSVPRGCIGVISDTHGLLRPEALVALEGVGRILHAGDIGGPGLIDTLARIAPVTAIRGNVDRGSCAKALPETASITALGLRIHMIHDRKALRDDPTFEGWDVVISGHSHRPGIEESAGVLWLNPGAAGPRRFRLPVTLAFLWEEDSRPCAVIHTLFV